MKAIAIFVLKAIAAGAFLYFVGDLSLRSCLAIVVLVALTWPWVQQEIPPTFSPFQLALTPNIGLMLIDLGLVTDEEWNPLVGDAPPLFPWTSLNLVHYGVNAAVLSSDPNGDYLVHWNSRNQHNFYTSRIATNVRLEFLKVPGRWGGSSPDFYMRSGRDGYEIGITVLDEWWKVHEERLSKSGIIKEQHREWNFGTIRLTLAVLPYRVFRPSTSDGQRLSRSRSMPKSPRQDGSRRMSGTQRLVISESGM
jgi:hypothetical protein